MADPASPPTERQKKKYPPGDAREPVILRVRMRRGLLNRIRTIVEYDRERTQGSWNLSDGVRETLIQWVARREAEIRMVEEAGPFTGESPDVFRPQGALGLRSG